jgi:WD40 repeat protein
LLALQIAGAAIFSVGIVLFSWLNPGWQPWSARGPATPEAAQTDAAPGKDAPLSRSPAPETFGPAQLRDLFDAAQRYAAAGDPVTAALIALETLREDVDAAPGPDDLLAAHRLLYEAHFNRKERLVLQGQLGLVNEAAFSPDGLRVVTASSDWTVRVWRVRDGASVAMLSGHDDEVRSAAFSPDGQSIASASADGTVRLWNAADGSTTDVLRGHAGKVVAVAFNPDGRRLVSASHDSTARLWDVRRGAAIAVLSGHGGRVFGAAFSPDGRRIFRRRQDAPARSRSRTS